jgi:hypothetical protein
MVVVASVVVVDTSLIAVVVGRWEKLPVEVSLSVADGCWTVVVKGLHGPARAKRAWSETKQKARALVEKRMNVVKEPTSQRMW